MTTQPQIGFHRAIKKPLQAWWNPHEGYPQRLLQLLLLLEHEHELVVKIFISSRANEEAGYEIADLFRENLLCFPRLDLIPSIFHRTRIDMNEFLTQVTESLIGTPKLVAVCGLLQHFFRLGIHMNWVGDRTADCNLVRPN